MSQLEVIVPTDTPPPKWADRAIAIATLILLAGVAYSLWCGSPLIWDGAYQLCETLIGATPYAYLSRFHTLIIWQPVAWLGWHTDNVRLLTAVYGAPFLLAPVVGLVVSWWLVRRQCPTMILWAALGTLATPLPGQIFVINDSIFQQHLFWPVLMAVLVRRVTPLQTLVVGLLAYFQFAHQIGAVLCGGLLITAAIIALIEGNPHERTRLWYRVVLATILLVGVGLKTLWISTPGTPLYDSYAPHEATWERAREAWLYGVAGPPLQGLVLVYLAGLGLLAQWLLVRLGRAVRADLFAYLAALCFLGTAAFWLYYAAVPGIWTSAINYRRWLVPLTVPIYILATAEAAVRRWSASRGQGVYENGPPPRTTTIVRSGAVVGLAGLFALVLAIQSSQFKQMSDRMQAEVMSAPTATVALDKDSHWTNATVLNHWGTSWQVMLLQGKRPTKWIIGLDVQEEHLKHLDGPNADLPLASFTFQPPTPGPAGWFDLRGLLAAAQRERSKGKAATVPSPGTPAEGQGGAGPEARTRDEMRAMKNAK